MTPHVLSLRMMSQDADVECEKYDIKVLLMCSNCSNEWDEAVNLWQFAAQQLSSPDPMSHSPNTEHCLNIKVQIWQIFSFRRSYIYQGPSASHCTRCFSPSFEFINNNLAFFLHVIYWNSHKICKIQILYCY